ncbi:MAG: TonB family protein [Victivallaceae bacterium]|nr:TonB family protein [Victivallaceae bacterium]
MFDSDKKEKLRLEARDRMLKILVFVFVVHLGLVFIPLIFSLVTDWLKPPKQNAFRVKIGGRELSHGPEVGPPERKRPGAPGPSATPAKKPDPTPTPKPTPKPAPKPTPKPKPVQKKPTPKKAVPKKTTAKKPVQKKTADKKQNTKKPAKPQMSEADKKKAEMERLQNEVYRPSGGGTNFNKNVPIGTRDRAQEYGKQDNRTPGGGATESEEEYGKILVNYIKMRWSEPPKTLLGDSRPSVKIELDIMADGRVASSRIVKASGNSAMDRSVKALLDVLDRVPTPLNGRPIKIPDVTLQVED